jgi:hypothetical protein
MAFVKMILLFVLPGDIPAESTIPRDQTVSNTKFYIWLFYVKIKAFAVVNSNERL